MRYYEIDFNKILKVGLLGKEHLVPPRLHKERCINDYVMYIMTRGSLIIENNGEQIELLPGDMYIFNKGDYQKSICSTECEYYYLHFDADCELKIADDSDYFEKIRQMNIEYTKSAVYGFDNYNYFQVNLLQKLHLSENNLKLITDKLDLCEQSYLQNSFEKRLDLTYSIEKVFITLENICGGSYKTNTKNMHVYNTVKKIADFINCNYSKDMGRYEIEKEFSINYDYANRIFKHMMGESIVKYRNNHRIERAKYLLLNTQKNIDEISSEVGFADKYYFCRCFAKVEGVSPISFKIREVSNDL